MPPGKAAIEPIGQRFKIDTVRFIVGNQSLQRPGIAAVSPSIPRTHGIGTLHTDQVRSASNTDLAFDRLESSAQADAAGQIMQIDMGLVQRKTRKLGAEHRQIESRSTEGDDHIVLREFCLQSPVRECIPTEQ